MSDLRVVWVEIEGFRRLRDRSFFDFRNPRGEVGDLIVIAGTNGGGKTTLLEALLFGLDSEGLIVRDNPKARRASNERGRFPAGARVSICVRSNEQYLRADRMNGRLLWKVVDEPFAEPGATFDLAFGPDAQQVEYFSSARAPALVGPVWPATGGRRAADTEANRLWTIKQKLVERRIRRSYRGDMSLDPWLVTINKAWATFHGDDGTRLADQPVDPTDEDSGSDLYVLEPDGTRRCSIDHASSGEIELLCMAGILTVKEFRGVLLIDEPELHLHPEWQARILPAIRHLAPRAQIIATSHASAPWDRAYNYQRYFLAPAGDPRRSDVTPPPERG